MAKQFDTSRSWDEFEIPSQHRNLKIEDLAVNLDWFIPKNWRKNENGELELNSNIEALDDKENRQVILYEEYKNVAIFDVPAEQLEVANQRLFNALAQKGIPLQEIDSDILGLDLQGALQQLDTQLSAFDYEVQDKKEIIQTFLEERMAVQSQFEGR